MLHKKLANESENLNYLHLCCTFYLGFTMNNQFFYLLDFFVGKNEQLITKFSIVFFSDVACDAMNHMN